MGAKPIPIFHFNYFNRLRFLGVEEATIEDLAFGFQSSTEVNGVDLRVCLSGASYAAAEKTERRMALKI